ncbi:YebC/PmpR family DNA-binding transcriptional regulator, partial [Mameliella sp. CS4]|nr:YebC/PmpR family DNA-binding transcriptional regulator [Mameliella sp. CS4]
LSDNRNRTVAEVRHAFTKCGGNLGTDGCGQRVFHFAKVFPGGEDVDHTVVVADDIFSAGFQRRFHHHVFVQARCVSDHAL